MRRSAEVYIPEEREIGLKLEGSSLGKEVGLARGLWGEDVNNSRLMGIVGQEVWKRNWDTIRRTGISQRQHVLDRVLRARDLKELGEEQIAIGARVVLKALEANNWDGADLLIIATSSPSPPSEDFADQIAERAGLTNADIRLYCMACNGAIAAFHDLLQYTRQGSIPRDTRVVIGAVEPLSYVTNTEVLTHGLDIKAEARKEGVDIDSIIISTAIFGNGASALAFRPKSFELHDGKSWIIRDIEGVIKAPQSRTYKLPPKEEWLPFPSWYDVEKAKESFAFTQDKVMQVLPEVKSNYDYVVMEGERTARFFAGNTSRKVAEFLIEYYQHRSSLPDSVLGVFHQPSAGILQLTGDWINKKLARYELPKIVIPWVLDRVGTGNVSAATTFLALGQLRREGWIQRGQEINLTGFGVGGSFTTMNLTWLA